MISDSMKVLYAMILIIIVPDLRPDSLVFCNCSAASKLPETMKTEVLGLWSYVQFYCLRVLLFCIGRKCAQFKTSLGAACRTSYRQNCRSTLVPVYRVSLLGRIPRAPELETGAAVYR